MRDPNPITRNVSFRWRVTLLAAIVVGVAVAVMAASAFFVVKRAMYADVDNRLHKQVESVAPAMSSPVTQFTTVMMMLMFRPDLSVNQTMVVYPDGTPYHSGTVPLGKPERDVIAGREQVSLRSVGDSRVMAQHLDNGVTLIVSEDLTPTKNLLSELAVVLFVVGACGVVLAAVAGTAVARGGLRPVQRLTEASERVARTDDLTPIPVTGRDELARLTMSFNSMLTALAESRDRQSRLVADAGHELRTPLTSLRTNVELLIAARRPGAPAIPEEEMTALSDDVLAQVEELTTLVGDLVDLAREDAPEAVHQEVDLEEVVTKGVERVQRRRPDVRFECDTAPWRVYGDQGGLSRAVINLLDNAAKFSPDGAAVRVGLRETGVERAVLTVADSGPGIPPEDRALVFERFYRSMSSRSMPGSGLGLAIVKQVVERHGGTITAGDSDTGGALLSVSLPGSPVAGGRAPQVVRRESRESRVPWRHRSLPTKRQRGHSDFTGNGRKVVGDNTADTSNETRTKQ
ncbi:HAMP domain-containing sensor histidine kinase [Tsukamurella sp. 8F]|uniref:HAMP domain-containing sensor histidine kinase n=1 Tax=unclassified Tsukamurella TaxID=2633480 RepID=UPI0023B886C6|nr:MULTISPECIES: HAMP domain-containing sensor histidine kinase [unclassified Tsukamurella]MDF0532597.1 HAMP domain-containing sensor histidine kinase [Tsukamurella sp. 8J]MDF0589393.1 HAMP domain-containing sensor histidine kinase [Tsukamurella sp. 8F]